MRYRIYLISIFLIFTLSSLSQDNDEIIVTFGNKSISKSEFEWAYKKNNTSLINLAEKNTPEEYLELFINFKLKVLEAEALGLDTMQTFLDELKSYYDELASTYLNNSYLNEEKIKELYERINTELKASHILIELQPDASPSDTLQAYNKIISIRNAILEGKDFNEAAYQYSDDPSARINNGDLGFFSAFQMIYPFEEAAYNLEINEISMPVRSSYGYHLIKIEDKRPAKGSIKVSHIMKSFPENATQNQKNTIKNQIDSIYNLLLQGMVFEEAAKSFSDDQSTAPFGGELDWFSYNEMISEFAAPAFSLTKNGDFTEPVLTPFGYHIIKRIDYKPIGSFEEMKPEIENIILNDPERIRDNEQAMANQLKNEYSLKITDEEPDYLASLFSNSDNNLLSNQILQEIILFEIYSKQFNALSYIDFLHEKKQNVTPEMIINWFPSWINEEILFYEKKMLPQKYPEFSYTIQEFYDGILLFNLSQEKIWLKAIEDTAGLKVFYENNKGKYLFGERFNGYLITCHDPDSRENIENLLTENYSISQIKDLIQEYNFEVDIEENIWEQGINQIIDYFIWEKQKPEGLNEDLYLIRGSIIPSEPKNLEQAKGLYISDYQEFLDEKWIAELREKYPVKINKKVLKSIEND